MEWFALRHPAMVHLPFAAALLAPIALLAAQRGGRGIRPWWTAARFLLLAGSIGSLLAVWTGFAQAWRTEVLPQGSWVMPGALKSFHGVVAGRHQLLALLSVPLGFLALRAAYQRRQEHQGLGLLPLFLGVLWSGLILWASSSGMAIFPPKGASVIAPAPAPVVVQKQDPENEGLLRILDFQRLQPMQAEPVKSPAHGNRWIRVWVTPAAAEAYAAGQPLPEGAVAVLVTLEDRWGRPGYEAGPFYALESRGAAAPALTYYWSRVPEARRGETGGAERMYLRGTDPGLQACLACHARGIAPARDRSQWKVPRRPKTEDAGTTVETQSGG